MSNQTKSFSIGSYFPFLSELQNYSFQKFRADLVAGLTVAIMALPQTMAYAIIAGIHPKYGLYAAIIPVIVSALFGSSKYLIAGPTNAISMVIASTMTTLSIGGTIASQLPEEQKIALIFLLAFLVGIIQVVMGMAKLGNLVNFISHSVIVGFTAGAGTLIIINQLKNLLGLKFENSTELWKILAHTFQNLPNTNWISLVLGGFTILFILVARRISKRLPGPLIAMIITAILVVVFGLGEWGVKLVGEIPRQFSPFSSFPLDPDSIRTMIMPALAIAILATIEAMSISKSIASQSGEKLDSNQEFVGQGLANISAAFFSGMPGTGSFTRSAVNFSAGAKSRFAGVFSGLLVLLTVLLLATYAQYIPIPSLAGIIIVIGYSIIDKKAIALCLRATRRDRNVLLVTFFATLLLEMETAIFVGVILSVLLFIKKVSYPQVTQMVPRTPGAKLTPVTPGQPFCPQIFIFEIKGALFFGAIAELENQLYQINFETPWAIIVRMKQVNTIDATAIHALESFLKYCHSNDIQVIFSGVKDDVLIVFRNSGILKLIGENNIAEDTTEAIKTAFDRYIQKQDCSKCPLGIFEECASVKKTKLPRQK